MTTPVQRAGSGFGNGNIGNNVSQQQSRSLSLIQKPSLINEQISATLLKRPNRVIINVGGIRFETFKSTLKNIPDTRLAWVTESNSNGNNDFDPETGEYFFDRHPGAFNMILNYYRTGHLHTPMDVCGPMFEEELNFWGIDEKQIEPCCWTNFRTHRDAQETLAELNDGEADSYDEDDDDDNTARRFGIEEEAAITNLNCLKKWRPKVWTWLEDSKAEGTAPKIFSIISVTVILASITLICAESISEVRVPKNTTMKALDVSKLGELNGLKVRDYIMSTEPVKPLQYIEKVITGYFTLELILRLAVCPRFGLFFRSAFNWIDIVPLITSYIGYIISAVGIESMAASQILAVPAVFRIFKLARHFSGLQILVHTMKASSKELILLFVVFAIFVVVYGTLVYIFEQFMESSVNNFQNIPSAFWWALVTMTTVGYGDRVPRSYCGYVIGVFAAISGVLVIALPVPIIVNNFALYYTHAQARLKLPKRRRRILVGAPDALKQQIKALHDNCGNNDEEGGSFPSLDGSRRKESEDSATTSLDSGIKGSSNNGAEQIGISVTFVDESDESDHDVSKTSTVKDVSFSDTEMTLQSDAASEYTNGFIPGMTKRPPLTTRLSKLESIRRRNSLRGSSQPPVVEGAPTDRRMNSERRPPIHARGSFIPGTVEPRTTPAAAPRRRSVMPNHRGMIPDVDT